jgi:hypothetical protein
MRYLILVILVLTCMAATIRIDGAWSPTMVARHVESALVRVIEPGKSLLSGLERRFDPRRSPSGGEVWEVRVALPRVMAGGSGPTTGDSSSCG